MKKSFNQALLVIVVLLILNSAFTLHNVWPTPWVRIPWELSVELAVLVLLLGWATRHGRALSPLWYGLLTLLMALLVIGRYVQITSPALFGRRINLYWDIQHVPNVISMMTETYSTPQLLLYSVLLLLLIGVFLAIIMQLLRLLNQSMGAGIVRVSIIVIASAVVVLYGLGKASKTITTEYWFSIPVSKMYADEAVLIAEAIYSQRVQQLLPQAEPMVSGLGLLKGGDVYIIFNESYGATVFDNPDYQRYLTPAFKQLELAVSDKTLSVVSAYVLAPTFAGLSWLSHSSFLAGIEITKTADYRRLLTSDRITLLDHFKGYGYRTVALKAGLKKPWPEGQFYNYDKIYNAEALVYRGPEFGWWAIPDQYSLAYLSKQELSKADRAPLLTIMATVATHSPFAPTPPYQPDWQRLFTEQPFAADVLQQAMQQQPDLSDLRPAYLRSVAYSLNWLAGFIENNIKPNDVVVMLGDHQPLASVSGPGARWHVPLHIISSNTEIVSRLRQQGFSDGLLPGSRVIGKIHQLRAVLLDVMDKN